MNITAIRADIANRLEAISGLQVYDKVPGNPQVPCVVIHPVSGVVHDAFERGASGLRFGLQVLVQLADWPSAQDALDGYLTIGSPTSIVDAVELNLTGGDDVTVENWDGYGHLSIGDTDYATVTLYAVVLTSA